MNDYELNYLLFNTNSIFHNEGLSIYSLNGEYFNRKPLTFLVDNFEKIKLKTFEDILEYLPDDFKDRMISLLNNAVHTALKYTSSIARQGVLFSHSNLKHQMKPHVHRQVYATEVLPCITVHYRLTGTHPARFNYWEPVTQQQAIDNDLCRRDAIVEWCHLRPYKSLELQNDKNVILFNSGLIPHSITHTDDVNVYFIFDHAEMIDPAFREQVLPIIIKE